MQARSSYTSSFRSRAILLSKCALLAAALPAAWLLAPQRFQERYPAVLADKFNRLRSIDAPKVVVIGNSNVAFGIDSAVLREALGRPVVNAGLHAGFSGDFLERMALVNPRPGDIYVLCHARYDDGLRPTRPSYLLMAMEKNWRLYSMLRPGEALEMLRGVPGYLRAYIDDIAEAANHPKGQSSCASATTSAYSRRAFNADGDNVFPREARYRRDEKIAPPPGPTPETAHRINALAARLRRRGASLVVAGIPVAEGPKTAPPEEFAAFTAKLQSVLDCPVISNFADYIMPRELFFDNCMHLTREGAAVRTRLLADDLTAWMATAPAALKET
ncbi:MAG: hypothetical protein IJP66_02825, partial [Kiritimatiellae bacterium]|nr:hypothetical protein [Kiritimatiellia bacterium]